jgi:hypothetical protein
MKSESSRRRKIFFHYTRPNYMEKIRRGQEKQEEQGEKSDGQKRQ